MVRHVHVRYSIAFRILFLDTQGQEEFQAWRQMASREYERCVIVTRSGDAGSIQDFVLEVSNAWDDKRPHRRIITAIARCDADEGEDIRPLEQVCQQNEIALIRTSAKIGTGVKEVLDAIVDSKFACLQNVFDGIMEFILCARTPHHADIPVTWLYRDLVELIVSVAWRIAVH